MVEFSCMKIFCTYEASKRVDVESCCFGWLIWLARVVIFTVIIVALAWNKDYQHIETESLSFFSTKLEGITYSGPINDTTERRFWDSTDLRIPPHEANSLFLTTNVIVTDGQEQSACTNEYQPSTKCQNDSHCKDEGEPYYEANGMSTGKCNTTTGYCILETWCPPEDDTLPNNGTSAVLNYVHNFSLLVKNQVYFPYFDKGKTNIMDSKVEEISNSRCRYDPNNDPYCPIFRIKTIVGMAGRRSSEPDHEKDEKVFKEMAIEGGVVGITVKWDCNFDYDERDCKPTYKFTRLDRSSLLPGYDFRYANYYKENKKRKRELIKTFGILFVLRNDARAGKLSFFNTFKFFGSSVTYFAIALHIAEFYIRYCHGHRKIFEAKIKDSLITREERTKEPYECCCYCSGEK